MSHQLRRTPQQTTHKSVRQRYHDRGEVGRNKRRSPRPGIHRLPCVIPQPPVRRSHGTKTCRRILGHHHASGQMDLQHLHDLHPRANWHSRKGVGMENVETPHVPQRGVTSLNRIKSVGEHGPRHCQCRDAQTRVCVQHFNGQPQTLGYGKRAGDPSRIRVRFITMPELIVGPPGLHRQLAAHASEAWSHVRRNYNLRSQRSGPARSPMCPEVRRSVRRGCPPRTTN